MPADRLLTVLGFDAVVGDTGCGVGRFKKPSLNLDGEQWAWLLYP